jgi:superfamily II DNA/RNA helicase
VLKQLEVERESDDSVDVLACTSMISVGVDVERLNAMVVLGQPKMSSEYIQASSRVGRGGQHGGVVVVSFSPTKPRDRSHYETFVRFHESMYRWVEPTSVTPHSPPALERALHASVIMVLRLTNLIDDNKAGEFDRQNETHGGLCEQLRLRLHKAVDPDDQDEVNKAIDEIIEWWHQASAGGNNLRFKSEPQFDGLMRMHSQQDKPPARATLNSMRNVDGDATAFVIKSGGTT